MSDFLRDLVQDLRRKHLWPVALLLLVALVAIPLLVAKPAKEAGSSATAPVTAAQPAPADDPLTQIANVQPVAKEGAPYPAKTKADRKFVRKDPFAPRFKLPSTAGTATGDVSGAGTATATPTGSTTDTTSGSTGSPTGVPTNSGGSSGGTKYYRFSVTVKFAKQGNKADKKKLTSLRALPSSSDAVVVFLGVRSDTKTAVFLLSSAATTTGDGKCVPSDDECSFVYMKKGDKNTIEVVSQAGDVTTYELEVVSVNLEAASAPSSSSGSGSASGSAAPISSSAPRRASARHAGKAAAKVSPRVARKLSRRQLRKRKRQQHRRDRKVAKAIQTIGF